MAELNQYAVSQMLASKMRPVNQPGSETSRWITFYFDDAPTISRKPQEVQHYAKVCEFRE